MYIGVEIYIHLYRYTESNVDTPLHSIDRTMRNRKSVVMCVFFYAFSGRLEPGTAEDATASPTLQSIIIDLLRSSP